MNVENPKKSYADGESELKYLGILVGKSSFNEYS